MSRLPLIDPLQTGEDLRAAFARMPMKLNIFRMLAHAENGAVPVLRLANAILHRQKLSDRHRELLILQVAHLEGGAYEWRQHVPIAAAVGISDAEIEAIAASQFNSAVFDAADRALLAFGKCVIEDVRVERAVFAQAQTHFSHREIVEAIVTIGFYMMMARLTEATETDLDPPDGIALYNASKHRGKK
jgi:alkylhydroperoxidase family enzyme